MNFSSVGDLANSLVLSRQSARLQNEQTRLTTEIASGRITDTNAAVRGDFSALSGIERSLSLIEGFNSVRSAASLQFDTAQTSLQTIADSISGLGAEILARIPLDPDIASSPLLADAGTRFNDAIAKLNTASGGRYLLSGIASDTPPIADPDVILADLRLATAAATTSADFVQAVDDWFNLPAGGFETIGYTGGAAASEATRIGENSEIQPLPTADGQVYRDFLRNLALNTLVTEGAFAGELQSQAEIAEIAAIGLVAAEENIIGEQALVGRAQQMIEEVDQTVAVETQNYEFARNELLSSDPFKAATELESVRTQIETLYLITAKNARLSLADYLR